jgi:hypothetical protein
MVRTQIQLTEGQATALKKISAERGISIAEVIREGVDYIVAEAERKKNMRGFLNLSGRFSSGLTDVSISHDKYLEEDYLA